MTAAPRELSVRAKLFLAIAVLVSAAAAAPVVFLPARLEERAQRQLEVRALDLARVFASASEAPLDFEDRVRAAQVLDGLAAASGAAYGLLLDGDGEPLASWGPVPIPLPELGESRGEQVWRADNLLHAAVPVNTASGGQGTLRLGLDQEELRLRRAESWQLVAFTALVVLLVGVAAAFAVGSALTRSVRRITQAAERITRGETEAAAGLADGQSGEERAVASALGSLVDQITAQRALLVSQAEASSEGILTLSRRGEVLTHNRRLAELWGFALHDLTSASWASVRAAMAPHHAGPLPAWLAEAAPQAPGGQAQSFDLALCDGRFLSVHGAPVVDAEGRSLGLGLYFRDLTGMKQAEERVRALNQELESRVEARTRELAVANQELAARLDELRRTQEQLVVADRRIAVGRLAAGVAHEVNNPLAYVATNLRYLAQQLPELQRALETSPPGPPDVGAQLAEMSEALAEAVEGADRVARIVRGLRAFSRPEELQPAAVRLGGALDAALHMAANELRHRARVERDYRPAPPVRGDAVRLQQVFLNLIINAAHAIPPGNADGNAIRVEVGTDAAGWAFAEVRDTGCGIDPEALGLIFDPFYTTKPQGEGTGLGLSISQGIVTSLGGRIEVQSELGRGSTFRVCLPPTEEAPEEAPPPPRPAPAPEPRLRILVVDDEARLGTALQRVLGNHAVELTTSGREALRLIEQGERYDRILCDLMMPAMTGMELHQQLQRLAPEQARSVVFMTGGVFTDAAADFIARNQERCLQKPLDPDALREALHART